MTTINLTELFEVQRKLDAEIERKHPSADGEDRLAKRILALQVELGECANEWRGFKFWSVDQKPRTAVYGSEFITGTHGPNSTIKNLLLEEYVDCLHFILSIGLHLRFDNYKGDFKASIYKQSIEERFIYLQNSVAKIYESVRYDKDSDFHNWHNSVGLFIGLGEMLGFTWSQIESAYMSKNKTNWERQADGY